MARAVACPPGWPHEAIGAPVDHQRRSLDPAQLTGTVARREDRRQLTGGGGRVTAAVVGEGGGGAEVLHVRAAGGADEREQSLHVREEGLALRWRGGEERPVEGEHRLAAEAAARVGHDGDERAHRFGMTGRQRLGDHSPHRGADHVRRRQLELAEQAGRVLRHVGELVLGSREATPQELRNAGRVPREVRRAAGVPVVEADDVEATARELLAEVLLPADHLHPESHDEQQRRVRGVAERLVAERDPATYVAKALIHLRLRGQGTRS